MGPEKIMSDHTPTFRHESHLDSDRWAQLVERDRPVRGWVRRGRQVKAVTGQFTHRTYTIPKLVAPLPDGSSWSNLDLCLGWTRNWTIDGNPVGTGWVNLHRIVTREKLCGSFSASTPSDSSSLHAKTSPDLTSVREIVATNVNLQLVETPTSLTNWDGTAVTDVVRCWVAPRATLGSVCDVDEVARWYSSIGLEGESEALLTAASIYLPDLAGCFDHLGGPSCFSITGLVLGYPPASTASM